MMSCSLCLFFYIVVVRMAMNVISEVPCSRVGEPVYSMNGNLYEMSIWVVLFGVYRFDWVLYVLFYSLNYGQ